MRNRPYPYKYQKIMGNSDRHNEYCGDRIRYYREKNGLTQQELADMVNEAGERFNIKTRPSQISQYENLICSPKSDKLYMFADAMGVKVEWLCGYGPRAAMEDAA